MKGILFSVGGYYVEEIKGLFHVYVPCITHAKCDSAYLSFDLAITRCKFLFRSKASITENSLP